MKHVKGIKPELRDLLENFLDFSPYQFIFKEFAKTIGYEGDDTQKIKNCLFAPNTDGEIFFSIAGMYDLFLEYQLIVNLSRTEPYKSLLEEYPEAIQNVAIVAKKIFNQEDIGEEDLVLIFDTDKYDGVREKVDEEKEDHITKLNNV